MSDYPTNLLAAIAASTSREKMQILHSALFIALFFLVAGCGGDGGGRMAIDGTVNYNGQPVEQGEIVFEPTQLNQPQAVGLISNGSYKIEAKHGPAPGPYKVRIDGYRMKADPNVKLPAYLADSGQEAMVREQIVPLKYKTDSPLTVEIVEGTTVYPFDIPAKP